MAETLIVIPGFGQSALREAGENGRALWPPQIDSDTLIGRMKGPFMKLFFFRRDAGFSDTAEELLSEYSAPLAFGNDGEPKTPRKVGSGERLLGAAYPGDEVKARYENVHVFGYDFLRSPVDNAALLDEFLNKKNVEKADFLTVQFGAGVLLSYLAAHGSDKVNRASLLAPCFQGVGLVADAYDGALTGDKVKALLGRIENKQIAGMREILKMVPPEVFDALVQKLVSRALGDVMLRSPGVWATADPARVPELIGKKLSDPELWAVRQKVEAYAAVLGNRESLLSNAVAVTDADPMKIGPDDWLKALSHLKADA